MEDIIIQISARRESALEDSDANLAALLFNVLGLINELQLDVQKWQISVNQGNEIIKELREQLRSYEHETETVKELKEKLEITTTALEEISEYSNINAANNDVEQLVFRTFMKLREIK